MGSYRNWALTLSKTNSLKICDCKEMGIYSSVMEEISFHTGLSPTAFFTIAALMVLVFRTVSSLFVSPEDSNTPPVAMSLPNSSDFLTDVLGPTTSSVQLGDLTEHELRGYNGSDPDKPLLISVRGHIYDVSSSRNFYGPGGPYSMFTGKEASRALALLSFKPQDINGNLEGLGDDELQVLQDWEDKFVEKYTKVGRLVSHPSTEVEEAQKTDHKPKDL